eukprot:381764_1
MMDLNITFGALFSTDNNGDSNGHEAADKVAIKQLEFDEMNLNLNLIIITDLFQENLNIVKFKPRELFLICGDLSQPLLRKYYNKTIIDEATQIENRSKILIDIAYGMT